MCALVERPSNSGGDGSDVRHRIAVFSRAMMSNGSVTVDDLTSFSLQTWIGEGEPGQPNDLGYLLTAPLRANVDLAAGRANRDA